jgi:hypothetical protein
MPTQNLGINITSSVGGAVPGINGVTNSLNSLSAASTLATRGISGIAPATSQAAAGLSSLRAAVDAGGRNLSQFSVSFAGVQRSLANTARPAADAGAAIQNLGRIVSDAPFGFIAIQNNLDPLFDSFRRLSTETGSAGGALRALGQSLIGGAGIGLAFTVVSSTITTLIQKYGSLSNAYAALNPFVSEAERFQVSLNKALADGAAKGQEEVGHLQLLYHASQDLNIPLGDRKKIVDELQKQYPDTFKGLSDEAILAGGAADAYDRLSKSLTAAAAVKATEELAAAQLKSLVQLRISATDLEAKLQEIRNPKGGRGIFDITDSNVIAARIERTIGQINDNKKEQLAVEGKLAQVQKAQLDIVEQYGAAALKINAIDPPKPRKVQKTELEKFEDILKGIDAAFLKLDSTFAATGGSLDKLSTDKIGVLSNALGDLAKFGVLPGTELFDQLKGRVEVLQSTLTHTPINFKIPINIEPLPAASNDAAIRAVTNGIKQKFADGMVDLSKIVTDSLQNGAADGIATIAAGIGNAIAGGGIKAALSGFVDAVANFGQSLGKQLIAQGIALVAFKASLDSLSGPQAIVAGAALVAASAAFKALAKGGVGSFATGGTVFGPQLALIGDNPGRQEHIIPSEVLDKLSGSNQGQLQFSLGVQDFIVWLERGYRNG